MNSPPAPASRPTSRNGEGKHHIVELALSVGCRTVPASTIFCGRSAALVRMWLSPRNARKGSRQLRMYKCVAFIQSQTASACSSEPLEEKMRFPEALLEIRRVAPRNPLLDQWAKFENGTFINHCTSRPCPVSQHRHRGRLGERMVCALDVISTLSALVGLSSLFRIATKYGRHSGKR